jgi:centrosomal protein CEP89
VVLEENSSLNIKMENLPANLKKQMNEIKTQAQVVLEENKVLTEDLKLKSEHLVNIEKLHIRAIGRLSKRVLLCETDKINLLNQIEVLSDNIEQLLIKNNSSSIEISRMIKLEDHLNQISHLKRKIELINQNFKHELE